MDEVRVVFDTHARRTKDAERRKRYDGAPVLRRRGGHDVVARDCEHAAVVEDRDDDDAEHGDAERVPGKEKTKVKEKEKEEKRCRGA